MMKRNGWITFTAGSLFGTLAVCTASADSNVALGKPVTLVGSFGSAPSFASSVTNGIFLPKNNQWQTNTVWWIGTSSAPTYLQIDLLGSYQINALTLQADDNDAYLLDYRDSAGVWRRAWDVPNYDFEPFGMQTRPDPRNDSARYTLPAPIFASSLRFYGNLNNGDRAFSVSEIQAFGVLPSSVPEPGAVALFASCGLTAGVLLMRKRKARRNF